MFQGFTQGAVDFLWGIRFNNEKSWFLAHKEEYLSLVDRPLRELGGQLHQAMEEQFPQLGLNLHVSRIYRDARRLHGRGPYKDHLWFTLRRPKEAWVSLPAFYFELAPEYYSFGMGCYDPTPATMAKLRARIDRDPKPLEKLARRLDHSPFQLEGELYKRPKGDPGDITTALNATYIQFQVDSAGDLVVNSTAATDADYSINSNGEVEISYAND